jgi:hypothetical protein
MRTPTREEQFVVKLLEETHISNGNPAAVYPILDSHKDCFDQIDRLLSLWAERKLKTSNLATIRKLSRLILRFTLLLQNYEPMPRAQRLQIALAGCEQIRKVITPETLPEEADLTNLVTGFCQSLMSALQEIGQRQAQLEEWQAQWERERVERTTALQQELEQRRQEVEEEIRTDRARWEQERLPLEEELTSACRK